jgi:D-alanyl-D-alanine dipeptidase
MLGEAEAALAAAKRAGDASARGVSALGVLSSYRPASTQFGIWGREYAAKYVPETRAHRRTLPGGEFSEDAAEYLAQYVAERVYPAGYSPHQEGRAVDLWFVRNGRRFEALTSQVADWQKSWFFTWLRANASRFNFFENRQINEPWHWEHRAPAPISPAPGSSPPPTP